jgi:hypothetical protein
MKIHEPSRRPLLDDIRHTERAITRKINEATTALFNLHQWLNDGDTTPPTREQTLALVEQALTALAEVSDGV